MLGDHNSKTFYLRMWVRGNGWMGFLLCGWMAAALWFLLHYPGLGGVGGKGCDVGCFRLRVGAVCSLSVTFYALISLWRSLPDI